MTKQTQQPPNNSSLEFKREVLEQSIVNRFQQIVDRYPDHIAVKSDNKSITYEALNKAVNRVAQAILRRRGTEAEPVAILFEHDISVIVAILGILKAGKFYVSLDPASPQTRSKYMLTDSGATLLLTNQQNLALATELISDSKNNCQMVNLDELDDNAPPEPINLSTLADTLCTIYYTSGSTGQPKGVLWNHRNALHHAYQYTQDRHTCPTDRVGLSSTLSFSVSITEVLGTLLNGAALHLFDVRENGLAQYASWLTQEQITIIHPSVSFFRHFLDNLSGEENFPHLRVVALGGQRVAKSDVELFQKHFSANTVLIHQLASTEANFVAHFIIDKDSTLDGDIVPAGYAIEDKEILLLDEHGNEVAPGQVGEITVRSEYLALGYWQRPDLTEQVFLTDADNPKLRTFRTGDMGRLRSDGLLEHLGRQDFQIKIRGYRVELAEIERILGDLESIKEAVVIAQEDKTDDPRLIAYVVPTHQPAPRSNALRSALVQKLPDYMIPATFVVLDALPLLPNGKIDRRALPMPDSTRPDLAEAFVAPEGPIEEMLVEIWQEVLGINPIGVHDNFFDLGGHSLLATQVISRILDIFEITLLVRTLFDQPTVADLALNITLSQAETIDQNELEALLSELEDLPDGSQLP